MRVRVQYVEEEEQEKKERRNDLMDSLIWAAKSGGSSQPLILFFIPLSSHAVYQNATACIAANLSYLPHWQGRNE